MLDHVEIGGFLYHPDISCAWEILQGVLGPATRKIGPFRDRIWIDRPGLKFYAEQTDTCRPMECQFNAILSVNGLIPEKPTEALMHSTDRQGGLYLIGYSEYDEHGKLLAEFEFESPDFEARYKAMLAQHGARPG